MKSLKHYSALFLALAFISLSGCATDNGRTDRSGTGETAGAYLDDSVVTTKVKTALFNEPGLDSGEITVETYKGVVQLSGFVESQSDIDRAVEVARKVEGVKSVKNDMRLKTKY
ncbi:BON domain-containing protein [Methylosarcina fibrata]|uniref:BON domain-containing protein n=1 Tax=Methylosarcina fibrata TaxID=105972 RepID=UPI00037E96B4|nr:BON domain-containing protein [Methylosarcina fibrata]